MVSATGLVTVGCEGSRSVASGGAIAEPRARHSSALQPAAAATLAYESRTHGAAGAAIRFPSEPGPFSPSLAQLSNPSSFDAKRFADTRSCAECHPDVASHWSEGAHARASLDNPYYRVVFESFQADAGVAASRLCAGCHDPTLLFDGAFGSASDRDEPASRSPEAASSIAPDDSRAHVGIPCLLCHSAVEATADGDGSYELDLSAVPLPDPADEASIEAHRKRLTPKPLRTEALCGSCHRSFLGKDVGLPHHLAGIDDLGDYRRSAYGGSQAERIDPGIEEVSCRSCHMPQRPAALGDMAATEGQVFSHRWPGAHTTLAAATGSAGLLDETRAQLQGAISIDVAAWRNGEALALPAETASLRRGERQELDIVLRNLRAAHRFPGGTRDLQDSWVEVRVSDARGRTIAEAGTRHDKGDDPSALRLRSVLLDEDGRPESLHRVQRFRALAFDKTIGPRDAMLVRYGFDLPKHVSEPLRVEARLLHRRHPLALQAEACSSSRSKRGKAFAEQAAAMGRAPVDACVAQPITEIVATRIWVGRDAERRMKQEAWKVSRRDDQRAQPAWARLYDHALALSHARQDDLEQALNSIERAEASWREVDPETGSARESQELAAIHTLRARVLGRQGRWQQALDELDRAEATIGSHPAIERARGHALALTWQWDRAARAYERTWQRAARDDSAASDWARALGSAGRPIEALRATAEGLLLQPRDTQLLRTQAIALHQLSDRAATAAQKHAQEARVPDIASALLLRCRAEVEGCDRDRQPIVTIDLR